MSRGAQREVLTPCNNVKHYLAGALDSRARRLVWVDGTRKNSALFCRLLDALVVAYPAARVVHVILDDDSIHSSRLVQHKLVELDGRVRLHFLPPYCPDHNRIEREWHELPANVTRNHRCPDMLALLVHVVLDLLHRNDWRGIKPAGEAIVHCVARTCLPPIRPSLAAGLGSQAEANPARERAAVGAGVTTHKLYADLGLNIGSGWIRSVVDVGFGYSFLDIEGAPRSQGSTEAKIPDRRPTPGCWCCRRRSSPRCWRRAPAREWIPAESW